MVTRTAKIRAVSSAETKFVAIYERHSRSIQAYCARRTTGAKVADAVAETFLVAWRRIDQVPDGEAALPWLYGVAYRVLSRQWRTRARGERLLERMRGLAELEPPGPDVLLVRNEEYKTVLDAATRLKPIDQEILRLTLWEELPYEDVAVVLGVAPSAAKQRAYRARRNLTDEYLKLTKERQPPTARKGGSR